MVGSVRRIQKGEGGLGPERGGVSGGQVSLVSDPKMLL